MSRSWTPSSGSVPPAATIRSRWRAGRVGGGGAGGNRADAGLARLQHRLNSHGLPGGERPRLDAGRREAGQQVGRPGRPGRRAGA